MALRGPEIERFVAEGPVWAGFLLAENVDSVANMGQALQHLGLQEHPAVREAEAAGKLTSSFAVSVIYRCDVESLFANHRAAKKAIQTNKDKHQKRREKQEQTRGKHNAVQNLASDDRPNWLFQCLLFDCLRTQEDAEASVFSLPLSAAHAHVPSQQDEVCVSSASASARATADVPDVSRVFPTMSSVIASGAGTEVGSGSNILSDVLPQLEDDAGELPNTLMLVQPRNEPACAEASGHASGGPMFFRVVHKRPSRQKIQQVSPALGQRLKDTDIAVTRHVCSAFGNNSARIEASPVSATSSDSSAKQLMSSTFLLDTAVPMGSRQALAEHVVRWEFDTVCSHEIPGLSQDLLDAFVELGAFEGRQARYAPDPDMGLETLEELNGLLQSGAVRKDEDQQGVGWQLTRAGMAQMKMMFTLRCPKPVCCGMPQLCKICTHVSCGGSWRNMAGSLSWPAGRFKRVSRPFP